jgi:Bacterial Ig-like domain
MPGRQVRRSRGSRNGSIGRVSRVLVALSVAAVVSAGLVIGPLGAQSAARLATTIEAVLADTIFFHGRQIAVRGATAEERGVTRLVVGGAAAATGAPRLHPVFVFWRQAPSRTDGEIRGEFWDLGRLREDDARFTSYDFRPVLEAASGGRWPNRDEVFVLLGATAVDAPEPTSPTVRAIVLAPSRFADRGVTVTGRFRGRNLFGDLASALNRSKWDFVVQSADAAIWVSGLRPRGSGFELDPGAKVDTGRFVEVSGTVHTEGSRVWIEGESLRMARPPAESDPAPPPPVIKEAPPTVIFTAPLAEEVDVATDSLVRLQFSRDMDGRTFRGRVRVSYLVTAPAAPPPGPTPSVTTTYRDGNRALEIKFAAPIDRFQTVKVELLEGITAMDGQPLTPWSMTFSTGAK